VIAAVKRFLGEFTKWASQRESILAVALIGSQARGTASACSDVDLVILARAPDDYLRDTAWVEELGHSVRRITENYGNLTVCRVWYQNGLEVEFGFGNESWAVDPGGQAVIAEGLKVLLDRGPLRAHHDAGATASGFAKPE